MMIVALGIPSAFAAWGFQVVRRLAEAMYPSLHQLWIDRFDPFEHDGSIDTLAYSHFPSRPLREIVSADKARTVVFTPSTFDAVSHQRPHHAALRETIATISASIVMVGDCQPQKHALFINGSDMLSAEAVIRVVAAHLGCALSPELVNAVLALAGPIPVSPRPVFTEAEEGVVTLALENSLAHLRNTSVPLKSIWPHRVFLAGDRPNEEAPLVAEATGGSRILFYGPYFHLAEGRWRAKLTLGFTKEAIGLPLKIWIKGPDPLGEARLRPRKEGIFAAQFNFTVLEPEHPIELQIWTEEGAIEGRIALGQAELTYLGREQATK